MDTTRVLVTYASGRGSTAEVAGEIRDRLLEDGVEAIVLPVGDVRNVAEYGAVVLGSAVYADRWRPEAVRFLRRNRRTLAERDGWLFQGGPLDDSADTGAIPLPPKVAALADPIGIRGHTTFGGKLGPDAKGFIASTMVANGRGGDFRNFDRIRAWADEIAGSLSARAR